MLGLVRKMFRFAKINPDAVIPVRAEPGSAGYDLSAVESKVIASGSWDKVATGIAFQCPMDCYGRVAPRSGLAYKKGVDVGAGVLDSSYRGEIQVILFNHGPADLVIEKGDRIAQLIFEKIYLPECEEVSYEELSVSDRGAGGFGSTGK